MTAPSWLLDLEEVIGPLNKIDETDSGLVATIGNEHVLLPDECLNAISPYLNQHIGLIRYGPIGIGESYRLRPIGHR